MNYIIRVIDINCVRDLPQELMNDKGWLNASTIDAFVNYANASFTHFGHFVKMWSTFNEPYVVAYVILFR